MLGRKRGIGDLEGREVGRGSKTEAGTEEKKGGRMDGPEKGD